MQRADVGTSRSIPSLARAGDHTANESDNHSLAGKNEGPPSPTSSTGIPVFVSATPRSDSPLSSSMSGKLSQPHN